MSTNSKANKRNLIEGPIVPQILSLTIPLLLGNVFQQLYNIFDSVIIGRFLGTEAFVAVGVAGTVMNLFIFILNGFTVGVAAILGQIYGSGNQKEYRKAVFVSFYFGSLFTLTLSLLSLGGLRWILALIQTPVELEGYIVSYLRVILSGIIITYMYNLGSSILRSVGNTRASLYFLALSVLLNIGLDYLAIGVLHFGIIGAAVATLLAQFLSAACCLIYITKYYKNLLSTRAEIGWHISIVKKVMAFSLSSALSQSSLYIGKMLVQGAVNPLGIVDIAAFTAATKIESLVFALGNSTAEAESIFVSQNYGAGAYDRVERGFKAGRIIHVAEGIVLSGLLFLSAEQFSLLFLGKEEQASLIGCVGYLQLLCVFLIICFFNNSYNGLFRGIGMVSAQFIGTTIFIVIRVVLTYMYVASQGVPYIATASGLGWAVTTVYVLICREYVKRTERFHLKKIK